MHMKFYAEHSLKITNPRISDPLRMDDPQLGRARWGTNLDPLHLETPEFLSHKQTPMAAAVPHPGVKQVCSVVGCIVAVLLAVPRGQNF